MDHKDSPKPSLYHRANNFLQKNILGLIILGISTSALWDLMKGTSGVLRNAILRVLVFVFHSYVDIIHQDIGKADTDRSMMVGYALLIMFSYTLSVCTFYLIKHGPLVDIFLVRIKTWLENSESDTSISKEMPKSGEDEEDEEDETEQSLKEVENPARWSMKRIALMYFTLIMLVIFLLYGYVATFRDGYARAATIYIDRSIDIIAPSIPPDKVLQLRAKYRSVDSAQKFYELHEELQTLAKEKNIQIPRFTPIKR